jgi:hypothetical protein
MSHCALLTRVPRRLQLAFGANLYGLNGTVKFRLRRSSRTENLYFTEAGAPTPFARVLRLT